MDVRLSGLTDIKLEQLILLPLFLIIRRKSVKLFSSVFREVNNKRNSNYV